MNFKINTNISAISAHKQATTSDVGLDKNLNSLSHGLRVNKPADDSAGLAVANKPSAHSLGQTTKNATTQPLQDVDFASESATFAKETILVQAGSYVITQANAEQQNVLRLLR